MTWTNHGGAADVTAEALAQAYIDEAPGSPANAGARSGRGRDALFAVGAPRRTSRPIHRSYRGQYN